MYNVSRKRRNSTPVRASRQSQVRRRLSFGGALPGFGSASFSYASDDVSSAGASLGAAITGGGSSKTSGFIATKLKAGRKKKDKFNVMGTTLVSEVGGLVNGGVATGSAGNVVAVGHACCPSFTAHILVWRAIVKQLLIKMARCDLADFNAPVQGIKIGDQVQVVYALSADNAPNVHTMTCTNTTTPNQIADNLATHFRTNYDPDLLFSYITFYAPDLGRTMAILNLKTCKLVFSSKSTLKVQNQTTESNSGDEESVNNVPLHGKAYFGYGTGTESITTDALPSTAARTFRADNEFGAIAKVPSEKWYQEVVPASQFTGVKQFGKVVLEPGHIKTSVLSFYGTFYLNSIYRKLFDNDTALSHTKTSVGKYRFMLLEKMIQATNPSESNAIRISYEVNLRMGCYAVMKNNFETSQQNNVMNLSAEI